MGGPLVSSPFAHPSDLKALAAPGGPTENSHTRFISLAKTYFPAEVIPGSVIGVVLARTPSWAKMHKL
jgi:hypothetical protein